MKLVSVIRSWVDSDTYRASASSQVDWLRIVPFMALHLACLGALWTGASMAAVLVMLLSYLLRMFAITAFYHRYFSHRAFKASRPVQFGMALLGASATQRGPLWWAAHHRQHHRHSDTEQDPHSPRHGFWWSHVGWFLSQKHFGSQREQVADLAQYPELVWLDRFDVLVPVLYAAGLYLLGEWLAAGWPGLGTSGWQMLVWGYFISTVLLLHVTLMINSVAHRQGRRRYQTRDDSRNNWWLALLTLGEGWHNNHHHFPGAARQGFRWYEIDISYYLLRGLALMGLVHSLKSVPPGLAAATIKPLKGGH